MENLRDLQEEARSLERAGRDAAAADLYDRILTDPGGARLGGMWAARARLRLRSGAAAEAASDMAASAERYEAAGLKNLSLAQWQGALHAHPEGPEDWLLRSARLAAAQGFTGDARRGYAGYADRAEAAGRTAEAVEVLREYIAAVPGDAAARRRLAVLAGDPEPAPLPPPPSLPTALPPTEGADPLAGLEPTVADAPMAPEGSGEADGPPEPPIALLDGFEPTAADPPDPRGDAETPASFADPDPTEPGLAPAEEPEPLPLLGIADVDIGEAAVTTHPEPDPEPLPLLGVDEPTKAPAPEEANEPAIGSDSHPRDYVDFGAMVLSDAPGEETRFQVAIGDPTGDEENDFAEILDLFRRNVSERLDPRDAASHYDLGLAFKQMGLLDDAIIHLQSGLRGGADPLATLEVLGECFVLRGQVSLAARVFDRATRLAGVQEGELVGVLYGLARCQEEMGHGEAARATFERVVGVDLSFRDAGERLRRLQAG